MGIPKWLRRPEQKDWLAEYHRLLESRGETAEIGCLRFQKSTGEVRLASYNHTECDGISALAHGLRSLGYRDEEFPRIPTRQAPSPARLLRECLRFAWNELAPVRPLPWRTQRPEPPYQPVGRAFRILSREQTEAVVVSAKKRRGTYNTLLLQALSEAVTEHLMERPAVTRWHIPVNLAGLRQREGERDNRFSNFVQALEPGESVESITREQFRHFRLGSHFATHFFLTLGDYYGFRNILRNRVEKDYGKPTVSRRITGTFSSLGAWPTRTAPNRNDFEIVVPFGNVSLKNPVCACNLIWHGQLAMSLQLHSSIASSPDQVEAVLESCLKVSL